jgi:hypothetical protein
MITEGRVHKKGHYANWESVMAAIDAKDDWTSATSADASRAEVQRLANGQVPNAKLADRTLLTHFGGTMDAAEWHTHCCESSFVIGVRYCVEGVVTEEIVRSDGSTGMLLSGLDVTTDVSLDDTTMLRVFSTKQGDENPKAQELFGFEIYGDAVVTMLKSEACFRPRWRFVDLSTETLESLLAPPPVPEVKRSRKKKKSTGAPPEPEAPSLEDFREASAAMDLAFEKFEKNLSKDAQVPEAMSCGQKMPSPQGADLAEIARLRADADGTW